MRSVAYMEVVQRQLPRLLSLLNRNPLSDAFGCFDRDFWHYKTLTDFPAGTFQQAVLSLVLLWCTEKEGNPYYRNPHLMEWAVAGMRFWAKIQHRDGTFDEFYENEHSFCATAFTTYSMSESLLLLRGHLEEEDLRFALGAVVRGADWLGRHDNPLASNQRMAALNALWNAYLLTGQECYLQLAKVTIRKLLESQHPEGWFPEYGGADVGYSGKGLDLLAHYVKKTDDREARKGLHRLLAFFCSFIHPDGSAGGEYGSRNGQHIFPYGLEVLASEGSGGARWAIGMLQRAIRGQNAPSPYQVDDRYFVYFYLNSYVQAFCATTDEHWHGEAPREFPAWEYFEGGGLAVARTPSFHAIFGLHKGGVAKVFHGDRLVYRDTGYFLRLGNGEVVASQGYCPQARPIVRETGRGHAIEVTNRFCRFDDSLPLKNRMICFKILCKTVLRAGMVAQLFHRIVKVSKISRVSWRPIVLHRSIVVSADEIQIDDSIRLLSPMSVVEITPCCGQTITHSPSTRYALSNELLVEETHLPLETAAWEEGRRETRVRRTLTVDGGNCQIRSEVRV